VGTHPKDVAQSDTVAIGNVRERWHSRCRWALPQMTDYLSEYGVKLDSKPAKKSKRKHKLHVLLYGDSIDRVMLEDICEIGGGVRQQCWVDPKSAR